MPDDLFLREHTRDLLRAAAGMPAPPVAPAAKKRRRAPTNPADPASPADPFTPTKDTAMGKRMAELRRQDAR